MAVVVDDVCSGMILGMENGRKVIIIIQKLSEKDFQFLPFCTPSSPFSLGWLSQNWFQLQLNFFFCCWYFFLHMTMTMLNFFLHHEIHELKGRQWNIRDNYDGKEWKVSSAFLIFSAAIIMSITLHLRINIEATSLLSNIIEMGHKVEFLIIFFLLMERGYFIRIWYCF